MFEHAEPVVVRGVPVAVPYVSPIEALFVQARVGSALDLVAHYAARQYDRLTALADGIVVFGTTGALGSWRGPVRLITLQERYVMAESTSSAELAATVIHEVTHAWLASLGFDYRPERRARIEAVCIRSEIAFARRIADGGELIAEAERRLATDPSYLSNEAMRQRKLNELLDLGVPRWVVWVLNHGSAQVRRYRSSRSAS